MTLSLLGIIFVQGYWIANSYKNKEEQFTLNVRQVLINVSKNIQLKETEYYYDIYSGLIDTIEIPDQERFSELIYTITNNRNNETYIFSDGILEEDYKLSTSFLDLEIDSIQFKKLTNRKITTKITSGIDGGINIETKKELFKRLKDYERNQFENAFRNISVKTPIHKRVTGKIIEELVSKELTERGLSLSFEYAVYSKDLATKIRSRNFQLNPESTYGVPLFVNDEFRTSFNYMLIFQKKKNLY